MPGFKSFTNTILTASDVNDFLMRQAVIQCTSTTRPTTVHDGMVIYETDTERYMFYEASDWRILIMRSWATRAPTLTNFTNAGNNVQKWRAIGKSVQVQGWFTVGALTSVNASSITADLPFTGADHYFVGAALFYSANTGQHYPGTTLLTPSGTAVVFCHANSAGNGLVNNAQIGNHPGFNLGGIGDGIFYQLEYEVA